MKQDLEDIKEIIETIKMIDPENEVFNETINTFKDYLKEDMDKDEKDENGYEK